MVLWRCPPVYARLRTGAVFAIVDISGHGCLVEGSDRLLPGRQLTLRMTTDPQPNVAGRVIRAYVHALTANAVRYRIAVDFDSRIGGL